MCTPEPTDAERDFQFAEEPPSWMLRVFGRPRLVRFARWVQSHDPEARPRCPWTSPAQAQCVRKPGHRGPCTTEYLDARGRVLKTSNWYGINFDIHNR